MTSRTGELNRRYMKEYRLRTTASAIMAMRTGGDDVPELPKLKTYKSVEDQVITELLSIPDSASRPGVCAGLLALARVLDDPTQRRVHAPTFAQLRAGLDAMQETNVKRTSKLSAIRSSVTTSAGTVAS